MKSLRSLIVISVLASTIALVAVGCGNGEAHDYVDEVNAIQTDLQTEAGQIAAGGSNPNQIADIASQMQDLFASAADDLEAVDPPEDVADLHGRLVEQVRSLGEQIGASGEAIKNANTPQEIQAAASELQSAANGASTELDSLINEINSTLQE
jgi:Family of unknown function (DUF6376)